MIDLEYSLIIEATGEPDYFGFYSPDLEGFTGIGHSIEDCLYKAKWGMKEHIKLLVNKVDALNVTDNQSSVMKYPSLGGCIEILKAEGTPVLQMTCRDRNRVALESDLLLASRLGIQNVLALTGDAVTVGDHPQAKPVFDLDSVSLLMAMNSLKDGKDLAEQELEGIPQDLFIGGIVTPGADPVEMQLIKMERKIEAGAQFFQTQAIYDPKVFEDFMNKASKYNVPVLCGIVIIKSPGMANYMNNFVPGVHVPEKLIAELTSSKDPLQTGIEIAARLITEAKEVCDGVHIMNAGKEGLVQQILNEAGIRQPA